MRDHHRAGASAPPGVQEEFAAIAARAEVVGRALDPVPVPEVETHPRRGSRTVLGPPSGSPGVPRALRVRLAAQMLEVAPGERAWTIAHELAHVLAAQEGIRPAVPTGFVAGTIAVVVTSAGCALSVTALLWYGDGRHTGLLFLLAWLGTVVLGLGRLHLARAEEVAADATAAAVFGEVLSIDGVHRLRRTEGRARYLPTVLRTHPHPAARRRAALTALARIEGVVTSAPREGGAAPRQDAARRAPPRSSR